MTVGPVAIPNHVVRCIIPGKGIGDLMDDPFGCGIARDADRYQPPPLVPEDHQNEEQPEADRRHDQEVHGGNARTMVAEKGLPSLRRSTSSPRHILCDRRLRDLNPELQQLTMDPWRAPKRVGQAHLSDQPPTLRRYLRPPAE